MRVGWSLAVVGLVAVTLTACTTVAEPEPGPQHLEVSSVEDLVRGCDSILGGYPGAARYEGDGQHPLVVFSQHLGSDVGLNAAQRPAYELANSEIPDDILGKPASPREVQLLACGNALPGDEQLNVCPYSSPVSVGGTAFEIPLFSQLYTFTVYELRTGRVVGTLQLESRMQQPLSSCPVTLENGATRIYAKAQPYELNDLFEDLVTGPAS